MLNDHTTIAERSLETLLRTAMQPDLPGLPARPVYAEKNTFQKITISPRTARDKLLRRFEKKLIINPELSRALVSFQANKATPFYRWFKYKEAFSAEFVRYVLQRYRPKNCLEPNVLDPFAGAGTTLSKGASVGWQGMGIAENQRGQG